FREPTNRGLARFIVINKLDSENLNFHAVVDAIQASLGKNCVLVNAPLGIGTSFKGVVSVLHPPSPVPAECQADLAKARTELLDAVAESDDALMEKYLAEGDLTDDELEAALPGAVAKGTVVLMYCTAGKKYLGVTEFLNGLSN